MKHGALKPLKQRKSARHLQRRAEKRLPQERQQRRTRKANRQLADIRHKKRVEERMQPERERQERNRLTKMLSWFSRFPAYEDVVKIEDEKLLRTWDSRRGEINPPEEIRVEQDFYPVVHEGARLPDDYGTDELGTSAANDLPGNRRGVD